MVPRVKRLEFYKCKTVERKIIEEEKKDGQ